MQIEKLKVALAVYMLEGETKHWWKSVERYRQSIGTPITWEIFQTTFYDKYFPESIEDDMEVEFLLLKQRDMFVSEYKAKFEELSKFPSYLTLS